MWRVIEAAAPSFRVLVATAAVHDAADIERAIGAFRPDSKVGLIVQPNPVTIVHRELIIARAARSPSPLVSISGCRASIGDATSNGGWM
jgi:hypothetical protein